MEAILQDLQDAGVLGGEAELAPLSGGVSCDVWRVRPEHLTDSYVKRNPYGLVVKAPLATLRTPALWQADVSRGFAESAALAWYESQTPTAVPRVVWRHPTAPVFAVESAPLTWAEWRHELLNAPADSSMVSTGHLVGISAHLGTTLAAWHIGSCDAELPEVLRTGDRLRVLRTDPFHRATAEQVPDLGADLLALAEELESARTCLVHGDFSPKNVLVSPPEAEFGAWMLDAEVAHVGDPALDVAYLGTHLACKAVARPELAPALNSARRAFEDSYRSTSPLVAPDRGARHTGAVLAARVRGVSRVTYLKPEQELTVLELATGLIRGDLSLDGAWELIVGDIS